MGWIRCQVNGAKNLTNDENMKTRKNEELHFFSKLIDNIMFVLTHKPILVIFNFNPKNYSIYLIVEFSENGSGMMKVIECFDKSSSTFADWK